ncbi:RsbRD N-terminal domain-containing protein [Desulfobacter vibrioformis]|uniref:RsbRD N-terminal domain-containing protein n=1 Tax=Desulfobacter vibrioformis TaxID=34031 RepID=UPI00054D56CE|nr:RsbRD N-terminal domain-containing protein [Desulfobacter vibrioformis]
MKQTIKKNRNQLLESWFHATINTYPEESARVLGKKSDRFDNPVGAVTRESLEDVLTLVTESFGREGLEKALDPVIRIRAVQAFNPADAVSFVFALKEIGESVIEKADIIKFYRLVDEIALAAFNRYMKCREDIFLLKATESKRRIHHAFERAGLVAELSEGDLLGSKKS